MYLPRQNNRVGLLVVALEELDEDDVIAAVMPILVAALKMGGGVTGAYVAILNRLLLRLRGPGPASERDDA
jgi:hypothetical protein